MTKDDNYNCNNCGQGYYSHHEILAKDGELIKICPTAIYNDDPPPDYRTKKERLKDND